MHKNGGDVGQEYVTAYASSVGARASAIIVIGGWHFASRRVSMFVTTGRQNRDLQVFSRPDSVIAY